MYNPLIGLSSNDEQFVAQMFNTRGALGITKVTVRTNRTGYSYYCYVKIFSRDLGELNRLKEIFGGNIQRTGGRQYVWQLPQSLIVSVLSQLIKYLCPVQQARAKVIITARQVAITSARTNGRNGMPLGVWHELDGYYKEIRLQEDTHR